MIFNAPMMRRRLLLMICAAIATGVIPSRSLADADSAAAWGRDQGRSEAVHSPSSVKSITHDYVHDDGTSEVQIGLFDGGDVMMINAFVAQPGKEWITHICPAWGLPTLNSVDIGHPYRVILYEDPNDDGDPSDAIYLTEAAAEVTVAHQDVFEEVPILPTRVEGGYFVAALYPNQAPNMFPLPIDETDPQGASWIAGEFEPFGFDVYDLSASALSLTGTPFEGNLLLRAAGAANGRYVDVRVTQIADGAPALGAEVVLESNGQETRTATTDRFGLARFDNLNPGWYGARATRNGLVSARSWRELEADAAVMIPLALPTRIAISGRVVDDFNDHGIAGAAVDLFHASDPGTVVSATVTGEKGGYVFDVEDPGTYVVHARKTADIEGQTAQTVYRPQESAEIAASTPQTAYEAAEIRLQTNVVVMLHGIVASSRLWGNEDSGMADAVRTDGWVVVDNIDLAGCVDVLSQFEPLLGELLCGLDFVETQAQAIQPRLEGLPVESFHVVAHSQGGLVARWYAEKITPSVPRIAKLMTLGTPHHGSQLAYVEEGIHILLGAAALASIAAQNPALTGLAVGGIEWWQEFNEEHPALSELKPNSDTIRNLNRGSTAYLDWAILNRAVASCAYDPFLEAYLVPKTEYFALRGTGGGVASIPFSAFAVGGGILQTWPNLCLTNDGIVPGRSASLWNGGDNVHNYSDLEIGAYPTHHKRSIYADALAVTPEVQTWVKNVLSGAYPVAKEGTPVSAVRSLDNSWARLTGFSYTMSTGSVVTDSVYVDATDSLVVEWMWVAGEPEVRLTSPSGAVVDSVTVLSDPNLILNRDRATKYGQYALISPETGVWTWTVTAPATGGWHPAVGSIRAFSVPGASVYVEPVSGGVYDDRRVEVTVAAGSGPVLDAAVTIDVIHPSGLVDNLDAFDDGLSPDLVAADGIYSAQVAVEPVFGATKVSYAAVAGSPLALERRGATTFKISPATDIAIVGPELRASNSSWRVGDTVDLSATVANLGSSAADVYVEFIAVDDGERFSTTTVPIAGGAVTEVMATTLIETEGDRTLAVLVRPVGDIADADWINNEARTTIAIGPTATGVIDDPDAGQRPQGSPVTAAIAFESVYPNPFNPAIEIRFWLDQGGRVDARIYDLQGRVVRKLLGTSFSQGGHEFYWDGRKDGGAPAASGVYFLQLESGQQRIVRKVALIK